jgi:hypothetical protein
MQSALLVVVSLICILFIVPLFSRSRRSLQLMIVSCIFIEIFIILAFIFSYPSQNIAFFYQKLYLGLISAFRSPSGYLAAEANILCALYAASLLWKRQPCILRKVRVEKFEFRRTYPRRPSEKTDFSAQFFSYLPLLLYGLSILIGAISVCALGHSGLGKELVYPLRHPLSLGHIFFSATAKAATLLAGYFLLRERSPRKNELQVLNAFAHFKLAIFSWLGCIFLGMLWAADSPGWGALWRWDAIERLSLASLCLILAISLYFALLRKTAYGGIKSKAFFDLSKNSKKESKNFALFYYFFDLLVIVLLISSVFAQNLWVRGGLLWGVHSYGANDMSLYLWAVAWFLGVISVITAYVKMAEIKQEPRQCCSRQKAQAGFRIICIMLSILSFSYAVLLYAGIFGQYLAEQLSARFLGYFGFVLGVIWLITYAAYALKYEASRFLSVVRIVVLACLVLFLSLSSATITSERLWLALSETDDGMSLQGISVRSKAELSSLRAHINVGTKRLCLDFEMGAGKLLWAESAVLYGFRANQRFRVLEYHAIRGLFVERRTEPWRMPLQICAVVFALLYYFPHKKKRFLKKALWKSGREDLNLRPSAPEADALPGCATPRMES